MPCRPVWRLPAAAVAAAAAAQGEHACGWSAPCVMCECVPAECVPAMRGAHSHLSPCSSRDRHDAAAQCRGPARGMQQQQQQQRRPRGPAQQHPEAAASAAAAAMELQQPEASGGHRRGCRGACVCLRACVWVPSCAAAAGCARWLAQQGLAQPSSRHVHRQLLLLCVQAQLRARVVAAHARCLHAAPRPLPPLPPHLACPVPSLLSPPSPPHSRAGGRGERAG